MALTWCGNVCPFAFQVNLDTLLAKADIITLHTPGGKDTKNLVSKATLDKCKNGVFIVNAGRGGVVNEGDLLAALESGKVSPSAPSDAAPCATVLSLP